MIGYDITPIDKMIPWLIEGQWVDRVMIVSDSV